MAIQPMAESRIGFESDSLVFFFSPKQLGGGNSLNHFFQFHPEKLGKIPIPILTRISFFKGVGEKPPASQWFVSFSYPKF